MHIYVTVMLSAVWVYQGLSFQARQKVMRCAVDGKH